VVVAQSSAWVGVIGAISGATIGIIGGGLTTWFVETRRWKREDQIRWHPDRRHGYSRFLKAADDYSRAGTQFALAVGSLDPSGGGRDELNRAHEEVGRAYRGLVPEEFEIELVAGPEVREAAAHVVHLASERQRAELDEVRKQGFDPKVVAAAVKRRIRQPSRPQRRSRRSSAPHAPRSASGTRTQASPLPRSATVRGGTEVGTRRAFPAP
jgi:hypothetical protein